MKTSETDKLEHALHMYAKKYRQIGCHEVTIGWYGKERVDYMGFDTKGVWFCYEIKVSKSDFHSKAKKTFVGNKNYYVMPQALYEEVKNEIPEHVGVLTSRYGSEISCVKSAKRVEISVEEKILWQSLLRSLCRGYDENWTNKDESMVVYYRRRMAEADRERNERHSYDHEKFIKDIVMGEMLKARGVTRQEIRDAMDEYDKRRVEEWKA